MRQVSQAITTIIIIIAIFGSFSVAYGAVTRIAVEPIREDITSLPLHVGIEKCFFEEEGLEREISYGVDPLSGTYALSNETIDYYIGPPARIVILTAAKNLPIRIIFFYFDKNLLYLMAQSQIKSVEELKGKSIAIDFRGSIIDYALRRTLKKHELDPDRDVTIRYLREVSRVITHLAAESVHAAVLPLPDNIFLEREGFHELRDFREEIASIPLLALATTEKKIENNPDQVEKMLKIARKSLLYTREYKDDVVSIMEDLMKEVDKETLYRIYDSLIERLSWDGYIDTKGLDVLIERIRELFNIQEEISTSRIFNLDLLKEKVLEIYRLIVIPMAAQCISPKHRVTRWDFWYYLTKDASKVTATVITFIKRQSIWQSIWDDSMYDRYKSQNPHRFIWYGKNKETGQYVKPGKYTCRIKSIDRYTGYLHSDGVDFTIKEHQIPVK